MERLLVPRLHSHVEEKPVLKAQMPQACFGLTGKFTDTNNLNYISTVAQNTNVKWFHKIQTMADPGSQR